MTSPDQTIVRRTLNEALSLKEFANSKVFNFAFCPSALDAIVKCMQSQLEDIQQGTESEWSRTIVQGCLVLMRNASVEVSASQQTLSLHIDCLSSIVRILEETGTFAQFQKAALQIVYLLGDWIDIEGERYAESMLINVQTAGKVRDQLAFAAKKTFARIAHRLVETLLENFRDTNHKYRNLICRCIAVIVESSPTNGPIIASLMTENDMTKLVNIIKTPCRSLIDMPWPSVSGFGLSTLFRPSSEDSPSYDAAITEEDFAKTMERKLLERACNAIDKSLGEDDGNIASIRETLRQSRKLSTGDNASEPSREEWIELELRDSGVQLIASLTRCIGYKVPSLLRPLVLKSLLRIASAANGPIVSPLHALHALRAAAIQLKSSSPEGMLLKKIVGGVMYERQLPDWLKMELRILHELVQVT